MDYSKNDMLTFCEIVQQRCVNFLWSGPKTICEDRKCSHVSGCNFVVRTLACRPDGRGSELAAMRTLKIITLAPRSTQPKLGTIKMVLRKWKRSVWSRPHPRPSSYWPVKIYVLTTYVLHAYRRVNDLLY